MQPKKSISLMITLLLCWSQTSNSFKLPNWLIAGSIVGIGGAYFFAKRYNPHFNSLWERLFAHNKKPADIPSISPEARLEIPEILITPPNDESMPPLRKAISESETSEKDTKKPGKKVSFPTSFLAIRFSGDLILLVDNDNNIEGIETDPLRLKDPITGKIEYIEAEYCPDAKPTKSCLKPISRVPNPAVPSAADNPSLTPIPATMPSTPEERALIPFSHAGQLNAEQNPKQPNTFWFPPELLALLKNKEIDPFSPLCIHLFDGKQTLILGLSDINAFPDAIQKSPEAVKMLLSAQQQLLGEKQASALAFLLEKAVQGLPIEFGTKPAITDDTKPGIPAPTTHRREYSNKPSAYGGTRNKPQQFGLIVQQGNNKLSFFSGTPQETYFSEQIFRHNSSIPRTEDLINKDLYHGQPKLWK